MKDYEMRRALRLGTSGLDTMEQKVIYVQNRQDGWQVVLEDIALSMEARANSAARRTSRDHLDPRDMKQAAMEAMLKHIDEYDDSYSVPFGGFVYQRMTGAAYDEQARQTPGFSYPASRISVYWSAIAKHGDDWESVVAYCQKRGISESAAVQFHDTLNGQMSFDADSASEDAYDGEMSEGAPVEAFLPFEWDNSPDVSVWEVIDTLSDKQKEAVRLYANGCNTVEMGRRLGISQTAAHGRLQSAIKNLRDFYDVG